MRDFEAMLAAVKEEANAGITIAVQHWGDKPLRWEGYDAPRQPRRLSEPAVSPAVPIASYRGSLSCRKAMSAWSEARVPEVQGIPPLLKRRGPKYVVVVRVKVNVGGCCVERYVFNQQFAREQI